MTLLSSEITIAASSEVIWDVLVDFSSYADWNPVEVQARGALAWKRTIVVPGLFDVCHHFEIDQLDGGHSRLRQFEHFSGVLVPFMRGLLRDTQAAFELANQAIKHRVESMAANPPPIQAG